MWRTLAARHPDRVGVRIGFDEGLAHRIEAGADVFLMPSRFEPCGLNQMYSLRYGTVPVVRATGGLRDTVTNYNPATGEGTGFTFDEYSPSALVGTLTWALDIYKDRERWRRIQQAGMREDNSWEARARNYVEVYNRA
jgi:starch synthase